MNFILLLGSFLLRFFLLLATFAQISNASEQIVDRISVVGKAPTYLKDLSSIVPITTIDIQNENKVLSVADVFNSAPQVNYNGQGGLLQTLSIRGLSRWRIQTMVEGVPIHTERRAGNAAEFIAPSFIGRATVLSGAASTQLGSGALGGGIDLRLATALDPLVSASYAHQQDYRNFQILAGRELDASTLYWGANTRKANRGKDAFNNPIFNGFEQNSAWIRRASEQGFISDALLLVSSSNNIDKASADDPQQRQTLYPNNDHWLAKLTFNWMNAEVYVHSARLDTQIVRPRQRSNFIQNKALGWGARIGDSFSAKEWKFNWELALNARSGVQADEQEISTVNNLRFDRTNLDGRQNAWHLSLSSQKDWDSWILSSGFRLEKIFQYSSLNAKQSIQDNNVSGFIGARKIWSKQWSSGVYLSSGFRVPTLTERFFFGSTPRGITQGERTLLTEDSTNLQTDIEYRNKNIAVSVSLFHQSIENYIERVSLTPSLAQYKNLNDVVIKGANYTAKWTFSPSFYVRIQGQWLWGEDNNGEGVNDISPNKHDAKLGWQFDSKAVWLNMSYRQEHSNPGSSEIVTDSVVNFQVGYEQILSSALTASIYISNLTDKGFLVSADELAPNAQGRDITLNLVYAF